MKANITEKNLWKQVWAQLNHAVTAKNHGFNTPSLAGGGKNGAFRQRIVVLRSVDAHLSELRCYTDRRSEKGVQLNEGDVMSWLFWDEESKIQFYGRGPTRWLPRAEARSLFATMPKHSRKAYATIRPPGTPLDRSGSGLPEDWDDRELEQTDYAAANFGVLVTQLVAAEVLLLRREGNLRLRANRTDGGDWNLQWIVP